jgi:type II secretory pathway component GspD/PulD (secretin)
MKASNAMMDAMTPVLTLNDATRIPVNNEIVTEILPVHSLNPVQLLKDLEPLIPPDDAVMANEAGNAIVMTACQKDIHRIAAIITALDSTAVAEVNVFALNYADAKSVAAELKELFQSADSDVNRASARVTFGGRFGRSASDGGGDTKEKTAPTRPVFVADEQMNAVAASASPDVMPMIARVVGLFDKPGQDVTGVEIFPLQHADPDEVVEELSSLFASTPATGSTEAAARPTSFQFGGPGMLPAVSRTATESSRLKRQATVMAVADRRTQSVIVAASENSMTQIRKIIDRLDSSEKGMMRLTVLPGNYADPERVLEVMKALFGGSASSATSQPQITSIYDARAQGTASNPSMNGTTSGLSGSTGSAVGVH